MLILWGFTEKFNFRRGVHKKIYRGKLLKQGSWTVCRFKGALGKKEKMVFFSGFDTPMHTMNENASPSARRLQMLESLDFAEPAY